MALAGIGSAAISSPAFAQTPDAGSLLKDLESLNQGMDEQDARQGKLPPPLPDTGQTITLQSVRFQGHEGLATEPELQKIIKDAIGKELGFNGLQHLADRVTQYLKDQGYFLAYAFLPEQDIGKGHLIIMIQPGRIDGAQNWPQGYIKKNGVDVTDKRVNQTLIHALDPEQSAAIRSTQIERGLLTLSDLAGVSAKSDLKKGSQPGTTRVDIELNPTDRYTGSVWTDNYGSRYTGRWRANGTAAINNLSGMGDQLSVMANVSTETFSEDMELKYGRLGYRLPVGYTGLVANLGASHMTYALGKDLGNLDLNGSATTANADLTYPLIRSRRQNVYLGGGYVYKTLEDQQGSAQIKDRKYHNLSLTLHGDHLDRFYGGGLTNYRLALTRGDLDRSGNSLDYSADQASAQTHGAFKKLQLSATRLQKITSRLSLLASASGQWTNDNLDSSEKFTLGGPNGVRGYTTGEGSGDKGWKATLETRYEVPELNLDGATLQLQAFVDTGHVSLQADPWDGYDPANQNTNGVNDYQLTSGGLGFSLSKSQVYSLRASYAWKINDDIDDRSLVDTNSDGEDTSGRFWLQAMARF